MTRVPDPGAALKKFEEYWTVANLARWDFNLGATRYGEFTTRVSETGTLELAAVPRDGSARWNVEFDVRGTTPG